MVSPVSIGLPHCTGGRQTISSNPATDVGVLAEPRVFLTEIMSCKRYDRQINELFVIGNGSNNENSVFTI